MVRDIMIVGAGGWGREAVWTLERINEREETWNILGFADDDPAKATGSVEGYPLLGNVEKASQDHPGAAVYIAIGDNAIRESIYRRLRGHDFPALIDPSAQVHEFGHGHGEPALAQSPRGFEPEQTAADDRGGQSGPAELDERIC